MKLRQFGRPLSQFDVDNVGTYGTYNSPQFADVSGQKANSEGFMNTLGLTDTSDNPELYSAVNNGKYVKQIDTKKIAANLKDWFKTNYNPREGITAEVPYLGIKANTLADGLAGAYQGISALGNISDINSNTADYNDLKNQLINEYSANPYANTALSPEQRLMMRKLINGNYSKDNPLNDVFDNITGNILPILGQTAIGGLTGGIPGALIGGIGSTVNSGMKGFQKSQDLDAQRLNNLYATLSDANQDMYTARRSKAMRRYY